MCRHFTPRGWSAPASRSRARLTPTPWVTRWMFSITCKPVAMDCLFASLPATVDTLNPAVLSGSPAVEMALDRATVARMPSPPEDQLF